jgi:hypothetical protein
MMSFDSLQRFFPIALIFGWQFAALLRLFVNHSLWLFGEDASYEVDLIGSLKYFLLCGSFTVGYFLNAPKVVAKYSGGNVVFVSNSLLTVLGLMGLCGYVVVSLIGYDVPTSIASLVVGVHLIATINEYYVSGFSKKTNLLIFPSLLVPFMTSSKSGVLQVVISVLMFCRLNHFRSGIKWGILLGLITVPVGVAFRTVKEGGEFSIALSGYLAALNRFHGLELAIAILSDQINIDHMKSGFLEYTWMSGLPTFLGLKPIHPGTGNSILFGYSSEFFVALGSFGGVLVLVNHTMGILILFLSGCLIGLLQQKMLLASTGFARVTFAFILIQFHGIVLEGSYFLLSLIVAKVVAVVFIASIVNILNDLGPASIKKSIRPLLRSNK